MINAEVNKIGTENALSIIRKFTRRVQGTGLVKTVRSQRYYARNMSKLVTKKQALKRIKKTDTFQQLLKEGKVSDAPVRRGYQNRDQTSASKPAETASTQK